MPIDYKKYPPNWKTEIRPRILKRANNCCEFCGVANNDMGYRDEEGEFFALHPSFANQVFLEDTGYKLIKIVLTIAHLDHDEGNHDVKDDRLAALCQKCHLTYDASEKARRRRRKKHKKQYKLFEL